MKKVLLVGAGLLVVLGVMSATKNKTETTPVQTGSGDIFTMYNNYVASDKSGYWFLIRDGKLYMPNGQPSLDTFFAANPGRYIALDFDVWTNYADKPQFLGGSF